jgi:hypothetical protein
MVCPPRSRIMLPVGKKLGMEMLIATVPLDGLVTVRSVARTYVPGAEMLKGNAVMVVVAAWLEAAVKLTRSARKRSRDVFSVFIFNFIGCLFCFVAPLPSSKLKTKGGEQP